MKDLIVKCTAFNGLVVGVAARTTNLVSKAQIIHNMSKDSTAAIGRTLTAASMMSTFLKGEKDTLTIQIKGNGPLGSIVVVSDSKSNVRGYVNNPLIDLPLNDEGKVDVASAVGRNGYINIIRDLGLREPYIGLVEIISGEIAEDIAYYYAKSEQIPSVISLGVLINAKGQVENAGGLIIQLLPGASNSIIDKLEERINSLDSISSLLSKGHLPQDILKAVLSSDDIKFSEEISTEFKCNCSMDRMYRNILSLGKEDIKEIFETNDEAQLVCHFCNEKYTLKRDEFKNLNIF